MACHRGAALRTLLWLLEDVCKLLPNFLSSHAIGSLCLLPAARIAIGALRYVSSKSAGQRQAAAGANPSTSTKAQLDSSSVAMCSAAVTTAVNSVMMVASDRTITAGSTSTHAMQVLENPHIMQCLCFAATRAALMPLVDKSRLQQPQVQPEQQEQQVSGDAGNQPTTIPTCQVPQPVEEMLQLLGCIPICQVLQPVEEMLQLLGCSKEVPLCVASQECRSPEEADLTADEVSMGILSSLIKVYNAKLRYNNDRLQHDGLSSAHGMLDSQAVVLLTALPAVLLQWAASIPSSSASFAPCCGLVCSAARLALCHCVEVNTLWQQEQGEGAQPGQEQQQNDASVPQPALSSDASMSLPQTWRICSSVCQLLSQVLPRLVQLRRLTAGNAAAGQPDSTVPPTSAVATVAAGAGRSGGRAGVSPASQHRQDVMITSLGAAVGLMEALTECVQDLLSAGNEQGELEAVGAAVGQDAVVSAPTANEAVVTAGQLCSLLEDLVRAEAAVSLAVFSSSSSSSSAAGAAGGENAPPSVNWNMVVCGNREAAARHKESLEMPAYYVGTDNVKVSCSKPPPLLEPILAAGILSTNTASPMALPAAQLYGLLCSMLKASACSADCRGLPRLLPLMDDRISVLYLAAVCSAAARVMVRLSATPEVAAASNRAALLPWLVLLGRCCLQLGPYIQAAQLAASGSADQQEETAQHAAAALKEAPSRQQATMVTAAGWLVKALLQWRAASEAPGWRNSSQQTVADWGGCDTQLLTQHLQALAAAHAECDTTCSDSGSGIPTDAAISNLAQQLQAVGAALTSIAMPYACNNVRCLNVSGSAEAQLVGGRSGICAGCRTARFCGRPCQVACWKQHKPVCKALAAAAAAAAAKA